VLKTFAMGAATGVGASLLLAAAGLAAEEPPGRYTMTPAEGGFVRLDKETGTMSVCTRKEGAWSCELMPDAQQALKSQIEKLEAENKALKEENERLPSAKGADAPVPDSEASPEPPGKLPMPTEQDVDKLFDYVEGMMKKFKERIQRLEREAKKDETPL